MSGEAEVLSENGVGPHEPRSQTAITEAGKAEAMILGRAKRYAKTEEAAKSGMLTDAQRADLEKLAAKYGIDEFRLEELIDEAFV